MKREVKTQHYDTKQSITLEKGTEMGRFKLGSTVVLAFPENKAAFIESLQAGSRVRMGEAFGKIRS